MIRGIYEAVGSFGWTIILFTLILKAITLPIEIWQRSVSHKNAQKMKIMRPMIEKIDKAYGENKRGAQAEKNKLFKKNGYSQVAGCIPTLITMAIFIFMMIGLSGYTAHTNASQYVQLQTEYYSTIETEFQSKYAVKYGKPGNFSFNEIDDFRLEKNAEGKYVFEDEDYKALIEAAQKAVGEKANDLRENFLWIKNIWRPDTWEKVMADYKQFSGGTLGMRAVPGVAEGEYNIIYEGVLEAAGKTEGMGSWNGLLLLPLLSLITQFLSMHVTMKAQAGAVPTPTGAAGDPAAQSQKMMKWMMPIMMVSFTLFYTAAFALYISSNAILSIISNLTMTPIIKRRHDKKPPSKTAKGGGKNEVSYRR